MNRKFLRATLLLFIAAAIAYAAAPSVAGWLGIKNFPDPMKSFVESGAKPGACQDDGVTLVVDFGPESGKKPEVTCASNFGENTDDTGWGIFAATGYRVIGTTTYPTGFVCRINGYPSAKTEPCTDTPNPARGSWTYFRASVGKGWQYSGVGASQSHPACGTWEGWRFVVGNDVKANTPRIAPTPFKCS